LAGTPVAGTFTFLTIDEGNGKILRACIIRNENIFTRNEGTAKQVPRGAAEALSHYELFEL